MSGAKCDPTKRFSDRVANYVRYRPGYPTELWNVLQRETGLQSDCGVADIGSGTGILSKLFLDRGNTAYAVEPNQEMRRSAETMLGGYPQFHSIDGAAEKTNLPNGCVDFIVAGQAFHWFDRAQAKREFGRILRPGGWCVLMWNSRRLDTAFDRAYEALLHQFGSDYREVNHKNIDAAAIAEFFSPANVGSCKLANEQVLDQQGLLGRLESCSYMPSESDPQYAEMCKAAERLFNAHACDGLVCLQYDTEIYFGKVA